MVIPVVTHTCCFLHSAGVTLSRASIAQLVEHALRKRMVLGSIPSGGFHRPPILNVCCMLHIVWVYVLWAVQV